MKLRKLNLYENVRERIETIKVKEMLGQQPEAVNILYTMWKKYIYIPQTLYRVKQIYSNWWYKLHYSEKEKQKLNNLKNFKPRKEQIHIRQLQEILFT